MITTSAGYRFVDVSGINVTGNIIPAREIDGVNKHPLCMEEQAFMIEGAIERNLYPPRGLAWNINDMLDKTELFESRTMYPYAETLKYIETNATRRWDGRFDPSTAGVDPGRGVFIPRNYSVPSGVVDFNTGGFLRNIIGGSFDLKLLDYEVGNNLDLDAARRYHHDLNELNTICADATYNYEPYYLSPVLVKGSFSCRFEDESYRGSFDTRFGSKVYDGDAGSAYAKPYYYKANQNTESSISDCSSIEFRLMRSRGGEVLASMNNVKFGLVYNGTSYGDKGFQTKAKIVWVTGIKMLDSGVLWSIPTSYLTSAYAKSLFSSIFTDNTDISQLAELSSIYYIATMNFNAETESIGWHY